MTLEANLQQEFRDRELLLRDKFVELHFARFMSQQARQELQTWEAQQRELYETRFRSLEYELHQHFAQTQLNQETLSVRYFRDLQAELEEAEGAYRETVQREARTFAQGLHQELNYHMTSHAQAQSWLSAERVLHEESLDNHTARWQQVLDMTTKGAQEETEQERTNNVELANDMNDLCLQLQEAETESLNSGNGTTGMNQESRQEPQPLPITPEALTRISQLESSEARVGGVAPSLPPTMAYPTEGVSSQLTIGQPTPCLPGSASKGPWAYTRERLQQQNSALPPQPLQQQLGGVTGSIGVPSVAAPSYGSASAAGAAYPAFASPCPCTLASALPQAQLFAH